MVGTFQYMSPEQVEGKPADARSDIFALGAVLYEMTTGKRAFEGKTPASAMAAVLERDPPPITSLQPMTPPAFERLVKVCLAKDPDDRWQTAHDVKLQLQADHRRWIADHFVGGRGAPTQADGQAGLGRRGRYAGCRRCALHLLSVSVRAEATASPAAARSIRRTKCSSICPAITAARRQSRPMAATSCTPPTEPTARSFTFVRLIRLRPRHCPETEGAMFPFWSPDSRSIAFFTDDKLKRIEVSGGTPVTICESTLGRGGSWSQDGTIVAALSYNTGISRVSANGGTPTLVTTVDTALYSSHRWPCVPAGRQTLPLYRGEAQCAHQPRDRRIHKLDRWQGEPPPAAHLVQRGVRFGATALISARIRW